MKTDFIAERVKSPIIFRGDEKTAYRDPAVILHNGIFYMFFTFVKSFGENDVYLFTAQSKSSDLIHWSEPVILTSKDKKKNFSSPGNIVYNNGKWIMCLQTYCRENGEKYGNENCRLYTMESTDLEHWSEPRLLMVKGNIPKSDMGRMIDPYLIYDDINTGKWFCFYKQNGISFSMSDNLEEWNPCGRINAGENPCIIRKDDTYYMFHSPENGIGLMTSRDLMNWKDEGIVFFLGQKEWDWARGRITAGMVLDCTDVCGIEKYIMFFHGSGPENEEVFFDNFASIGIAFSDDLRDWDAQWI